MCKRACGELTAFPLPRNKSGIWGWRSEKMEVVSGYEAKVGTAGLGRGGHDTGGDPPVPGGAHPVPRQVYSASNVELVTKTRTEHLSDQDKSRSKGDSPIGQSGSLTTAGTRPPSWCKARPLVQGPPLSWVGRVSGVGCWVGQHVGRHPSGVGHCGRGVRHVRRGMLRVPGVTRVRRGAPGWGGSVTHQAWDTVGAGCHPSEVGHSAGCDPSGVGHGGCRVSPVRRGTRWVWGVTRQAWDSVGAGCHP